MPNVICIETGKHRTRVIQRRDARVEKNLHLVADIAGRVHAGLPPSFDLDDLISEGTLGLIQAAQRYRPSEHNWTPFSAYARKRIRGAMMDSVRRRRYTDNTHQPLPIQFDNSPRLSLVPNTEAAVDEKTMQQRLARALTWLTPADREVILGYYASTGSAPAQAAFRRRKNVIEMHPPALERLRVEFRRAA